MGFPVMSRFTNYEIIESLVQMSKDKWLQLRGKNVLLLVLASLLLQDIDNREVIKEYMWYDTLLLSQMTCII